MRCAPAGVCTGRALAFLLLAGATICGCSAESAAAARASTGTAAAAWVQPRFLLSMWYDPVVPASEFPARYREIRDANMTVRGRCLLARG